MTDQLEHTKAFLVSLALDGFGVRRFMSDRIGLGPGRKYVQEACARLYAAVMTDDPAYDAEGAPTEALSQDAVKAFVVELEREKVIIGNVDPGGSIDEMMFTPGQYGCFLDDLIAAVKLDDPSWRTVGGEE